MASLQSSNPTKRIHHMDVKYNYRSPTIKKAMKTLKNETASSTFKYLPILSSYMLVSEVYCEKCFAVRDGDMNDVEWDLHLTEPHNYACQGNKNCNLRFVEEKHRRKHSTICVSSSLLLAARKELEKECNRNLINFAKRGKKQKRESKKTELVWITNYDENTYCCSKLRGYGDDINDVNCTDAKYLNPMHNPPIPLNECYFNNGINNDNDNENKDDENKNEDNNNHNKLNSIIAKKSNLKLNHLNIDVDDNTDLNDTQSVASLLTPKNLSPNPLNPSPPPNNAMNEGMPSLLLPNLDVDDKGMKRYSNCAGMKRKSSNCHQSISIQPKFQTPPHKKQKLNNDPYCVRLLSEPQVITSPAALPPSICNIAVRENHIHHHHYHNLTIQSNSPISYTMSSSLSIQPLLSTSQEPKHFVAINNHLRVSTSVNKRVVKKRKKKKKKKKKQAATPSMPIIISSESEIDEVPQSKIKCKKSLQILKIEWPKEPICKKFEYIFHPFHIYSVSQQFIEKQNKDKKTVIPSYKLQECDAAFSKKGLNENWKSLKAKFKEMRKEKSEKFNGSELSFEFLNFVQIIPSEEEIKKNLSKYIVSSDDLQQQLKKLFDDDTECKFLKCYKPKYCQQMQQILMPSTIDNALSIKSRIFLYSFLRCGVGLLRNALSEERIKCATFVHNAYYDFLNHHFNKESVYGDATLRDIDCDNNDSMHFKEFVFRNAHIHRDYTNCTLDLSLKMGGISCDELEIELEQNDAIKSLKSLYNAACPNKELRLVNMGFFQSPPTNPGQNWHTDYEFTPIDSECTILSPVVTVIISLIEQKCDINVGTKGSTVFALGSHHSPSQIIKMCKKYPKECNEEWLYRVIQPILNKGDLVAFAGHTMHFGGAYNLFKDNDPSRIVLYAVLHLLPKNAAKDEYLETDMNIFDGKQVESLFGGGKYVIRRKKEDEENESETNPYAVKKSRWRDRR